MLPGRVYRIFQRYADIHVTLDLSGGFLRDTQGRNIGMLESIVVRRNRIWLKGYAQAHTACLQINRTRKVMALVPDPARGGSASFELDVPLEEGPVEIILETEAGAATQVFSGVTSRRLQWARRALALRYMWTLVSLLPEIHAWKWRGNLSSREVVKQRLGLVPRADAVRLNGALLKEARAPAPPAMATLVMPVFNAFDMLPEALSRIERHSGVRWRLVLVEDCSSDARVRPFVQEWTADAGRRGRVHLICNERNLGFVGAVNRALKAAQDWPDDPVVLLNSDVNVAEGWLGRLLAPLAGPAVASVTPMSNDAEIFTVPALCRRGDIAPGAVDEIDAAAARFDPLAALAEAPTGIGFCMAMSPRFLAQVPFFDTVFGRGYGEETDWCQKTRALGGRHIGAGNVFVEHRGGASFGSAAKQRLLEKNLAEITRRYPRYDAQVQDFIRHDPMATARLALGLAWAGALRHGPVPVYLGHALGGGAEMFLQRCIAQDLASGGSAVVVRVGQVQRWQIELHTPQGRVCGTTDDTDLMIALVGHLPQRRVVYSCGVGDRDAVTLPDILLRLSGNGTHPVDMLVHDYFPVSPNYTLLGSDGHYHGVPLADTDLAEDPAHHAPRPRGLPRASLADWQAAWGRLVDVADRVTVFCESSRAILAAAYPQAEKVLEVVPHTLSHVPARIPRGAGENGKPVIGVLGNIGVQKGAAVVRTLSRDLARQGGGRLVVIGHMDPDFRLVPPSRVHGGYELRDLPSLVARYGITCWLIPSIWPETFSFTTHEALATGLPVFAFDLGGQGDAVATAVAGGAEGGILPLPGAKGMDAAAVSSLMCLPEVIS